MPKSLKPRLACSHGSGLGCGDPVRLAALRPGETVLDLGCGPGFDCLLAAHHVGSSVGNGGLVVGADSDRSMLMRARSNAAQAGVANVSLACASIEALPFGDASVDVVVANCVLNLCPDKRKSLQEMHRVLRPGGRLAIADILTLGPSAAGSEKALRLYGECVSGAVSPEQLAAWLSSVGFAGMRIAFAPESDRLIRAWAPGRRLERLVAAAEIVAAKPAVAAKPGARHLA